MTLDQLRIFLEVARLEHVTNAAASLNMTQSAVSAAISGLERRHDVRLFDRVGRRIELTTAGCRFRDEAAAVLRRAGEAEQMLADIAGAPSGPLRVAASQTVASYWLPPHLVRFHEAHPVVTLTLIPGNTASAARAVRAGDVELAVVEGAAEAQGLDATVVARDRLALIVGPAHPWADGRALGAPDLPATGWIMREPGSGTRAAVEADLSAMGLDPAALHEVLELQSNEACLAAVAAGRSATVVSARAAAPHLAAGSLRLANFSFPERHFTALAHATRHRSRALEALLDVLRGGADPA